MPYQSKALTTINQFKSIDDFLASLAQVGLDELSLVPFNPFPAGSIYMSVDPTDPSRLFGGKWQALNEGRVLIGAGAKYPAGTKGGEETHTLTTSEMPSHNHSLSSLSSNGSHYHLNMAYNPQVGSRGTPAFGYSAKSNACGSRHLHDQDNQIWNTSTDGYHSHSLSIYSEGSGNAHNNMQPYMAVYMWACISQDGMTRAILQAVALAPTSSPLTALHLFLSHSAYEQNQGTIKEGELAFTPFNPFPIGAIYMSMSETNPALLFGGQWQPLNEGRVLIGANSKYPVGTKGGEETHTLTTSEMPPHSHGSSLSTSSAGSHSHGAGWGSNSTGYNEQGIVTPPYGVYFSSNSYFGIMWKDHRDYDNSYWKTATSGSHSHDSGTSTNSTGNGAPHNNLQPYLAVNIWQRTA